jgi:hypothetical protein
MGKAKPANAAADPAALITRKTGDWWQDDRRNWCAYCGVSLGENTDAGSKRKRTYDHVIPRAHKGRHVTIPACQPCNANKGKTGLPEFMVGDYFSSIRQKKRPNQWSLRDLWLVMALAAVEQARSNVEAWPAVPMDRD